MRTGIVEVLQINLDQKNILIIEHPSDQNGQDLDIWFQETSKKLLEWVKNENSPLFVMGNFSHIETRLEKVSEVDGDEKLSQHEVLLNFIKRIAEHHCLVREERHGLVRHFCFFCGHDMESRGTSSHGNDCLYIAIKNFVAAAQREYKANNG